MSLIAVAPEGELLDQALRQRLAYFAKAPELEERPPEWLFYLGELFHKAAKRREWLCRALSASGHPVIEPYAELASRGLAFPNGSGQD